ncbi:MAG: ACT domain-containing protein [Candidatus Wildermuthbacteria bacterium]|nr:ACT domain-containing protein [Candidatus Wildermuthbacteria bacterium]
MKNIQEYFSNGQITVSKKVFAIATAKELVKDAFAAIQDEKETTVVVDQSKLDQYKDVLLEIDRDWKIITFDLLLPIDMVGFIATVANALAEEGISILVISSYSTDHILVQDYDLAKAITKIQSFGCKVVEK